MSKFKHTTAAYSANQAKKRKRNQRQDPVRRQEEQECNAAARRQIHVDNPERREHEQQRDTETHQQILQIQKGDMKNNVTQKPDNRFVKKI